jgi:hypothetical protein
MKGKKTGGRVKGSVNKATPEIREGARAFVEDAQGRAMLLLQYQNGSLHPSLVQMFFHYAYGKPKESLELSGGVNLTLEAARVLVASVDATDRP